MPSISKKTMGRRLDTANSMLAYVTTLPLYKPDNVEIKPDIFQTFLNDTKTANTNVASTENFLADARTTRIDLYWGVEGLINVCSRMRDKVSSNSAKGREDKNYKKIQKLI